MLYIGLYQTGTLILRSPDFRDPDLTEKSRNPYFAEVGLYRVGGVRMGRAERHELHVVNVSLDMFLTNKSSITK